MSKFNRNLPYSTVEGDSRAAYYQGGQYFTAEGKPISHEEAALPSDSGAHARRVERAIADRDKPTEAELNRQVQVHDPANPQNQQKDSGEDPRIAALIAANETLRDENEALLTKIDELSGEIETLRGEIGVLAQGGVDPKPTNGAAGEPEVNGGNGSNGSGPDARREKLESLSTKDLNNLVAAAGAKKFTGAKARFSAIDWLLANTE